MHEHFSETRQNKGHNRGHQGQLCSNDMKSRLTVGLANGNETNESQQLVDEEDEKRISNQLDSCSSSA